MRVSSRDLSSSIAHGLPRKTIPYHARTGVSTRRVLKRGHLKAFNSSLATASSSSSRLDHPPINQADSGHSGTFPSKESRSPIEHYQHLIDTKVLRGDEHQTRIIHILQDLHNSLAQYNPPHIPQQSSSNSLLSRFFTKDAPLPTKPPEDAPKGLYLHGDVGTGKTMLMDLFYNTLPPSVKRKRRVNFHAFMIDVHKRLHGAKLAMGYKGGDPIVPVARDLAREAYILCFDEFQASQSCLITLGT
jgi:protein AFG1